jgi:hypothetical protein
MTRNGAGDGVYVMALVLAAFLASDSGDVETAVALLEEAVRHGRDGGNHSTVAGAVGFGVLIMANLGQPGVAAVLSGAGGGLAIGVMRSTGYLSQYEDTVAGLRQELGSTAYDAAFAKGSAMSYEQVAGFFLSELARVAPPIGDV